jgi:hypothetical protein
MNNRIGISKRVLLFVFASAFTTFSVRAEAKDDLDTFKDKVQECYGSLPAGYDVNLYARVVGGKVSSVEALCIPDNTKLADCACQAALSMPWEEKVFKGPERHFNVQLRGEAIVANGPMCGNDRDSIEEEIFARNLRALISKEFVMPDTNYPLTNVYAVAEVSEKGVLTKLWVDSSPKRTELEKALTVALGSPGLIKQLPTQYAKHFSGPGYPAQFWVNAVTEKGDSRKFFGINGPFLTDLEAMDKTRAIAANDPRYSLAKEYDFWLQPKLNGGGNTILLRSSMPIEYVIAARKQKGDQVGSQLDANYAAKSAANNKPLLAAFTDGQKSLQADDLAVTEQRIVQCTDLAETDGEAKSTASTLCFNLSQKLTDAKKFDAANALLNESIQKFLKRGFYISAVNAAMGLVCTASEKKDKDAAMAAAALMRNYLRLAVNALKPGQVNEAGEVVGMGFAGPMILAAKVGPLLKSEDEGKQLSDLAKEISEMAKEANKIAPTKGLTFN